MKFVISRVSGETPPCEDAVSEEVIHTHYQQCHKLDKQSAALRFVKENNPTYRIENGVHKWDVILITWTIEIDTLEELVALQEKVGELIFSECNYLKIYDGYIE